MVEENKPEPSKPTHELKIHDPDTGDTAIIGSAFYRPEDGRIVLKFIPGVMLTYDNLKRKVLALFPIRTAPKLVEEPIAGVTKPVSTSEWKKEHPEYVRKVHFSESTRSDCPNRVLGKPTLTDDPEKVTCSKCKKLVRKKQKNPPPQTPQPPPSAA